MSRRIETLLGVFAVSLTLVACASDTVVITALSTPPIDVVVTNEKITITEGTAIEIFIRYIDNFELGDGELKGWSMWGPIAFQPFEDTPSNELTGHYVIAGLAAGEGAFFALAKKGGATVLVEVLPQEQP